LIAVAVQFFRQTFTLVVCQLLYCGCCDCANRLRWDYANEIAAISQWL